MKILLIYPTRLDERQRPIKFRKAFLPPLPLAIIDRLTPSSHQVRIIDDVVESIDFSVDADRPVLLRRYGSASNCCSRPDVLVSTWFSPRIGGEA